MKFSHIKWVNDMEAMSKDQWRKLTVFWATLAAREKKIISIGALVLLMGVLYGGIWMPYLDHINALRERIQSEQKTLNFMMNANKKMAQWAGQAKPMSPRSLVDSLGLIQEDLARAHLQRYLSTLKQLSDEAIQIEFTKVDFDPWLDWLIHFNQIEKMDVSQVTVQSTGAPGVVMATLVIKVKT